MIRFEIPMAPVARKNPKPVQRGGHPMLVKPHDEERATQTLMALAIEHRPPAIFDGPLRVALIFRVLLAAGRASSWEGAAARAGLVLPDGKPDVDNCVKFTLDALKRSGQFFRDDAQVVVLSARKEFADRPGIVVEIEELPHVASSAAWRAHLAQSRDGLESHAPLAPSWGPPRSREPDLFDLGSGGLLP